MSGAIPNNVDITYHMDPRTTVDQALGMEVDTDPPSEAQSQDSKVTSVAVSFVDGTFAGVEMQASGERDEREMESLMLPYKLAGGHSRAQKRSGGIFGPNELVRADEIEESEGFRPIRRRELEVEMETGEEEEEKMMDGGEAAEDETSRKRKFSRRPTATLSVRRLGRKVKRRIGSLWRKKDSKHSSVPLVIASAAAVHDEGEFDPDDGLEEEGFVLPYEEDDEVSTRTLHDKSVAGSTMGAWHFPRRSEEATTVSLSNSYQRDDGGPCERGAMHMDTMLILEAANDNTSLAGNSLVAPTTLDSLSPSPPSPAIPAARPKPMTKNQLFWPHLDANESVTYTQLSETILNRVSYALHSGNLSRPIIQAKYDHAPGNLTTPSEQEKASADLRAAAQHQASKHEAAFRRAEGEREAAKLGKVRRFTWIFGGERARERHEQALGRARALTEPCAVAGRRKSSQVAFVRDRSGSSPDAVAEAVNLFGRHFGRSQR